MKNLSIFSTKKGLFLLSFAIILGVVIGLGIKVLLVYAGILNKITLTGDGAYIEMNGHPIKGIGGIGLADSDVASIDYVKSILGVKGTANIIPKFKSTGDGLQDSIIYDNGNVGIGMTEPGAKLEVKGTATYSDPGGGYYSGAQLVIGNLSSGDGKRLDLGYDTTNDYAFVNAGNYYPASGEGPRALVLQPDGGNVGIGTTGPTQKLEVAGNVKITGSGIYNSAGYQLVETNATDWTRWNQGSGSTNGNAMYQSLSLGTGGLAVGTWSNKGVGNIYATGILQIAGTGNSYISGNVGIGTTDPGTYKLKVSGTGNITGSTDIGGNLTVMGGIKKQGKIVFVTNETFTGNLFGLSGADDWCRVYASNAGLSGIWKAWLSTSAEDAKERVGKQSGPYVLVDGTVIANNWADLIDGNIAHSINLTESGVRIELGNKSVWTGTMGNGTRGTAAACYSWTSSSGGDSGTYGSVDATDESWTYYSSTACNSGALRLYCFQQ